VFPAAPGSNKQKTNVIAAIAVITKRLKLAEPKLGLARYNMHDNDKYYWLSQTDFLSQTFVPNG
jgi:hypothetical protein